MELHFKRVTRKEYGTRNMKHFMLSNAAREAKKLRYAF